MTERVHRTYFLEHIQFTNAPSRWSSNRDVEIPAEDSYPEYPSRSYSAWQRGFFSCGVCLDAVEHWGSEISGDYRGSARYGC